MNRALLLLAALCAAPTVQAGNPDIAGLALSCNNCHGVDGVSVGPTMPSIGGLSEPYLFNVMMQWKTGERYSAAMGRLIKGYTDQEIAALAAHFASKPWKPSPQTFDAKLLELGKDAVSRCTSCHGENGAPDEAETPRLTGQWAKYMELELMKYRDDALPMPHRRMRTNAKRLSEADVAAVAAHYASQQK